jgi:hypothetical protein
VTATSWLLAALVGFPLAYVLPASRLMPLLEAGWKNRQPLRIEAELSGVVEEWPSEIRLALHPTLGYRIEDDRGGRWVIRGGRVLAGTTSPPPPWIPELEILALNTPSGLRDWLARAGVDVGTNDLGRCGEGDCYVLGGRRGGSQVWIDKDSLEIVRWASSLGRRVEYLRYTHWDGQRFPAIVELRDDRDEPFATLVVHDVRPADDLVEADFSASWVGAPRSQFRLRTVPLRNFLGTSSEPAGGP